MAITLEEIKNLIKETPYVLRQSIFRPLSPINTDNKLALIYEVFTEVKNNWSL